MNADEFEASRSVFANQPTSTAGQHGVSSTERQGSEEGKVNWFQAGDARAKQPCTVNTSRIPSPDEEGPPILRFLRDNNVHFIHAFGTPSSKAASPSCRCSHRKELVPQGYYHSIIAEKRTLPEANTRSDHPNKRRVFPLTPAEVDVVERSRGEDVSAEPEEQTTSGT